MPAVIPIIAAVIGAAGLGESVYALTNQPSAPKPAAPTPAETEKTATDTRAKQEAALQAAFPNIQAATGGSLSPEAWATLAKLLTDQANAPGIDAASEDLLKKFFGENTSLVAGVSSGSGSVTPTGLTPSGGVGG